ERAVARDPTVQRHLTAPSRREGLPGAPCPARARRVAPARDQPPRGLRLLSPPRLGATFHAARNPGLGHLGHAARCVPLRAAAPTAPGSARAARGGGPGPGRLPRNPGADLRHRLAKPARSLALSAVPVVGPGRRERAGNFRASLLGGGAGVEPAPGGGERRGAGWP